MGESLGVGEEKTAEKTDKRRDPERESWSENRRVGSTDTARRGRVTNRDTGRQRPRRRRQETQLRGANQ